MMTMMSKYLLIVTPSHRASERHVAERRAMVRFGTGVGFEHSWFFLQAGWHVSIYDPLGQTIGQFDFAGPPDALDNIQMWI